MNSESRICCPRASETLTGELWRRLNRGVSELSSTHYTRHVGDGFHPTPFFTHPTISVHGGYIPSRRCGQVRQGILASLIYKRVITGGPLSGKGVFGDVDRIGRGVVHVRCMSSAAIPVHGSGGDFFFPDCSVIPVVLISIERASVMEYR